MVGTSDLSEKPCENNTPFGYDDDMQWRTKWKNCRLTTKSSAYQIGWTILAECRQLDTAKWIWDSSIFSSIKPKYDKWLFVYFCVFPRIYLFCAENCSEHHNKTTFCSKQVNSGKNTKVNKQSLAMFWLNWRKYGFVSYSLSCTNKHNFHFK